MRHKGRERQQGARKRHRLIITNSTRTCGSVFDREETKSEAQRQQQSMLAWVRSRHRHMHAYVPTHTQKGKKRKRCIGALLSLCVCCVCVLCSVHRKLRSSTAFTNYHRAHARPQSTTTKPPTDTPGHTRATPLANMLQPPTRRETTPSRQESEEGGRRADVKEKEQRYTPNTHTH